MPAPRSLIAAGLIATGAALFAFQSLALADDAPAKPSRAMTGAVGAAGLRQGLLGYGGAETDPDDLLLILARKQTALPPDIGTPLRVAALVQTSVKRPWPPSAGGEVTARFLHVRIFL